MNPARLFSAALCLGSATFAQVSRPAGITTLTLGADVANGIIAPAPSSRVRVPPLEQVRLLVPEGWSYPIQWTKDNKPMASATGRSYPIALAATSDSGFYNITGAPFPFIATGISLDVVTPGHLGNFSTRLELAAGSGVTQIVGFFVAGTSSKSLLIRTVGPSLRPFGVTKPAAQPRLRFFDAAGKEIGFTHPAVVVDLAGFFSSVGAFALTGGETSFDYGPFPPGAYTVHVSDQSSQGGTVLVEAYEFSTGPAPQVTPIAPPGPGG